MTTDTPTCSTVCLEGGVVKKQQRYKTEFRTEAVKLVIEQGLSQEI